MYYKYELHTTVACPACGVKVGDFCVKRNAAGRITGFTAKAHAARVKAEEQQNKRDRYEFLTGYDPREE